MGRAAFYDQPFLSYEGFCDKTRIFSLQKVQKIQFWAKWLHNIYLTKVENMKYKHCPKLWTSPFPEQEKMQEKLNLKYLKMLKTEN